MPTVQLILRWRHRRRQSIGRSVNGDNHDDEDPKKKSSIQS